jgi:hypothetical protein
MKRKILLVLALLVCAVVSASGSDSCEWADYVGNPQRTAYTACDGPDKPEILWKATIPGDFDTPPFIMGDNVLILCKDDMYHTSRTTIVILDLLTGNVLQKFVPLIPNEHYTFEIFPLENQIIGTSFTGIYDIDLDSEKGALLTEIPHKFYGTPNLYPVVLEDILIFPTDPPVCLSKSDFDTAWNAGDILPYPDSHPYNLAGDETIVVFIMEKGGITRLLAVEPSTGMVEWMSDPLPLSLWLALGEDTIYCGGRNLWTLDNRGSELWHFEPDQRIASNIVLGPDAVYIADYSHSLYKIGLDGTLMWKTEWDLSPWYYETHLIGAGNTLYCIGTSGGPDLVTGSYVTAFNMEDGSKMWNLEFESSSYIRAAPAIADGILVIGRVGGIIMALASDPHLFVRQGDAFLSEGLKDEAISSYEKAAQLYEERGDLTESREIQERILELENSDKTKLPELTTSPTATPEPILQSIPIFILIAIVCAGALGGISIVSTSACTIFSN